MRSQDELRAALGLLLLAAAAWCLPALRGGPSGSPPLPKVLYSHPGDGRLLWSPAGEASPSPASAGIPGLRSLPPASLGGWRGLLLGNRLDVNRAGADDLTALPGIGARKAAAILETREELGRFRTLEELLEVPGIGEKTLEKLRPLLRVEGSSMGRKTAAERTLLRERAN